MSIGRRFLYSLCANATRAAVSVLVGLVVARGLGPSEYGNLAYLLGSFWAIRALLDMGTSSAFYTFIAQRKRGRVYYLVYFGWLAFQFILSLGLVAVVLPSAVIERFWLGQERSMIVVALLATFMQNQVWQTVVQAHEAARKTVRIQVGGTIVITVHLLLVLVLLGNGWLNVQTVLWCIAAEYLVASVFLSESLRESADGQFSRPSGRVDGGERLKVRQVILEYVRYCQPMAVIGIFSACYEITDRWLLQNFGGSIEQGFFQVASQLATISLLATTSILNILWKEVAEACDRGDHSAVVELHRKTTRILVLVATTIACFLGPWAEALTLTLLGTPYREAWPVLFVMLFYPIYQAMGQVNGTLFMATGHTRSYMKVTISALLLGLPMSYGLIAPQQGAWPSGLGLGAFGLAVKTVGLSCAFVNIQSWMISRIYGVCFEWRFQVTSILSLLILAYFAKFLSMQLVPFDMGSDGGFVSHHVLFRIVTAGLIYFLALIGMFLKVPGVFGVSPGELGVLARGLQSAVARFRRTG